MSTSESSPKSPSASSTRARRPWTPAEDAVLKALVAHYGDARGPGGAWKEIGSSITDRTAKDCRKRWFHSLDPSLRKGRWTPQEDETLLEAYSRLGPAWHDIASLIPGRKDDQCSKRYNDILNPLARNRLTDWTPQEDELLRQGVHTLGHRWSAISSRIPGRPPLTCRNRWRTLSRKAQLRRSTSKNITIDTPSSTTSQMSAEGQGDSPYSQDASINSEMPNDENVSLDHLPDLLEEGLENGDQNQDDTTFLNAALYETFSGSAAQSGIDLHISNQDQPQNPMLLDGISLENSDQNVFTPRPDWANMTRPSHVSPRMRHPHPPGARNHFSEPSNWSCISSIGYDATSSSTHATSAHHTWSETCPFPPGSQYWELSGEDFNPEPQTSPSRLHGPPYQVIHVHHHYHYHITKSDSPRPAPHQEGNTQQNNIDTARRV